MLEGPYMVPRIELELVCERNIPYPNTSFPVSVGDREPLLAVLGLPMPWHGCAVLQVAKAKPIYLGGPGVRALMQGLTHARHTLHPFELSPSLFPLKTFSFCFAFF